MKLNNFKKHLVCWGAGDQSIVLNPIINSLGAKYDIFIDDTPGKISPLEGIELLKGREEFEKWFSGRDSTQYGFVVAIGNPYGFVRCKIHDYLVAKGLTAVNICDSSALLEKNITVEDGVQIMKAVIVNSDTKIGKQCILNTRSTVEHHDHLGMGVEIGPASTLCGRVDVKDFSWIGAGSTILPRISIGKNSIVGGGALVRENVKEGTIVAGVPAKFIKLNPYKESLQND
ncbi:MAG: NeuD/PglB/VioB family sugar acetyltransferase [Alphaproteobacteria bacterium]